MKLDLNVTLPNDATSFLVTFAGLGEETHESGKQVNKSLVTPIPERSPTLEKKGFQMLKQNMKDQQGTLTKALR